MRKNEPARGGDPAPSGTGGADRPESGPGFDEVPTLPLPSRWRLLVAALVALAFLFFLYHSYQEPADPDAPAGTGTVGHPG